MSFQYKIKTDVAAEPVTLDEVKRYLRIDADYASDDEVLEGLITSARERLELFTNIGFAERELELQWSGYPIKRVVSKADIITFRLSNARCSQYIVIVSYYCVYSFFHTDQTINPN